MRFKMSERSLFALLLRSPWWVSFLAALAVALVARLVLPDHPADLFAEALRRFVFRRKLKIEVPADRAISGAHAAPAHAQGNLLGTAGDAVELDMGGDGGPRTLRLGTAAPDATRDRALICGSPQMLADFRGILDRRGFTASPRIGTAGEYVFERAFVEK